MAAVSAASKGKTPEASKAWRTRKAEERAVIRSVEDQRWADRAAQEQAEFNHGQAIADAMDKFLEAKSEHVEAVYARANRLGNIIDLDRAVVDTQRILARAREELMRVQQHGK